jgi:hypothetical protein
VCRSAVEAIIEQLGTDQLDTLFLALPLEAVPLIGQNYSIYLCNARVHTVCFQCSHFSHYTVYYAKDRVLRYLL